MKSGLINRRTAAWALAAVILAAALFGAFGHAHHAAGDHGAQPCAACVATILVLSGLVLVGVTLIPEQNRVAFVPIPVQTARKRLFFTSSAQRAPPRL